MTEPGAPAEPSAAPGAPRDVAVVGAGPAGLMAAEVLARGGASVTVYDRMPSAGRKFLLAGRGGLNLTHSEAPPAFLARYREADPGLAAAIEAFPPSRVRAWCEALGQPTFVGTSGRVFPEAFKSSPLLRAWLGRLAALGVVLEPRHRWLGWTPEGALRFEGPHGAVVSEARASVLALGGASWPRLGADGGWVAPLAAAGIAVRPLRASNCGVVVPWTAQFRARFEGVPLKRVSLTSGGETARGDVVVTREGLEGGAVYALGPAVREALAREGETVVAIDLRPDLTPAAIQSRLEGPRGKASLSSILRKRLKLPPLAVALLREATGLGLANETPGGLARLIGAVPLRVVGTASLDRAISTAGGVPFAALDDRFMLRGRPGVFLAGEMLDWDAPTGGYLLQACLSTGAAAGAGALAHLGLGAPA